MWEISAPNFIFLKKKFSRNNFFWQTIAPVTTPLKTRTDGSAVNACSLCHVCVASDSFSESLIAQCDRSVYALSHLLTLRHALLTSLYLSLLDVHRTTIACLSTT